MPICPICQEEFPAFVIQRHADLCAENFDTGHEIGDGSILHQPPFQFQHMGNAQTRNDNVPGMGSRQRGDTDNPAVAHVKNGGKLFLEVVCAENLLAKPNAYVTAELDGQLKKTCTRLADRNPSWNARMVLDVVEYFGSAQVVLKVWDRSVFGDQCLGTVRIPLLSCLPPSKPFSEQESRVPGSDITGVSGHLELGGQDMESHGDFPRGGLDNMSDDSSGVDYGEKDVVGDNFRRIYDAIDGLKKMYTLDKWFLIPELSVATDRILLPGKSSSPVDSSEREDLVYKKRLRNNTNSSRDDNEVDDDSFQIHSSGISGISQSLIRMLQKKRDDRDSELNTRAVDRGNRFSLPAAAASAFCCSNVVDEMASPGLVLDSSSGTPRKPRSWHSSAARNQKMNTKRRVASSVIGLQNLRPRLRVRVRYVPLCKSTRSPDFPLAESILPVESSLLPMAGMSEVHCAAMFGHTQLLLSLAEAVSNAYPNVQVLSARCVCPGLRWTALDYAVVFRHRETVKTLVKRGHQGLLLLGKSPTTFATPLHLAVYTKDLDLLQIVTEAMLKAFENETKHARVNQVLRRVAGGEAPSQDNIPEFDNFEGLHQIGQQNVNLNDNIETAAHAAQENGNEVPLNHANDVEEPGLNVQLNLPVEDEPPPSPLDTSDASGNTAIAISCRIGFLSGVMFLLKARAKIDTLNNLRETPLILATQNKCEEIAETLINVEKKRFTQRSLEFVPGSNMSHQLPCRPNAQTLTGESALHYAARAGSLKILQRLLKNPLTRINPKTYDTGRTPMHEAALNGHFELVKALIERYWIRKTGDVQTRAIGVGVGIDGRGGSQACEDQTASIMESDNFGNSPRNLAEEAHHDSVVSLLIEAENRELEFLMRSQQLQTRFETDKEPTIGQDKHNPAPILESSIRNGFANANEIDEDFDYEYPFDDEE